MDGKKFLISTDHVRSSEVPRGFFDRLASDSPEEMLRHREASQNARLDAGLEQF